MAQGKKSTARAVWDLAEPLALKLGLSLWDVRFQKEGVNWYLRVFIDREDGPIGIEDCVRMSRALDAPLDEADPIAQSYSLQVSSPGIERELTRGFHFRRCLGKKIMVRLIRAVDGKREYKGALKDYDRGAVTLQLTDGRELVFEKKEASSIRLDEPAAAALSSESGKDRK